MGSYNVACSISHMSICPGEKVAYIPLQTSKYPYGIGDGNNTLIYKHCFYSPVTLPIFGEYFDYGYIDPIEENFNTKIIEKHFNMAIKDIISLEKMPKPINSGMFIRREVYEFLLTNLIDDCGRTKNSIRDNFGDNLENLFQKHQKSLVKSVQKKKDSIKLWKSFPQNEETKDSIKYHKSLKYWDWVCTESSVFQFRKYKRFNNIYQPQMLKGKMKKELIDFILFEMGMYAINCFYFPAMNGEQFGNKYASRNFYRKCHQVMVKDIKERKE